jgi:stage V sporulation protein S
VAHPASVDHIDAGYRREATTFFDDDDNLLKVSASSPPHAVATALVRAIQEGKAPIMRAIGHGAVGQAVKAQIIARGIAAPLGIDLVYLPAFDNVANSGGDGTLSAVVWRTLWR